MKISLKLAVLLCVVLMIFNLSGCGVQRSHSKTVYFASHDEAKDYMGLLYECVRRRCQDMGLQVEYMDAKRDSSLQIEQVNKAVDQGAAAIVLLAVDGTALIPAVERANKAGVPVIATNRDLNGGRFAQVMSDEKQAGRLQGAYMAKHLPQGAKVVYLMGQSSLGVAVQRWEGFMEACLGQRPDVQLLMMQDCAWNEADAYRTMSMWLKIFPQIDGVIAGNDAMALGALRAMKEAGRDQGVLLSGVDGLESALKAVEAGEMAQTVKQDGEKAAEEIAIFIKEALSGRIPTEGVKVPFEEITRENLAEYRQARSAGTGQQ